MNTRELSLQDLTSRPKKRSASARKAAIARWAKMKDLQKKKIGGSADLNSAATTLRIRF